MSMVASRQGWDDEFEILLGDESACKLVISSGDELVLLGMLGP